MTILSVFDPELEYTQANTAKYTEVTRDGGCCMCMKRMSWRGGHPIGPSPGWKFG
jgi:hypothetical protein